MGYRADSLPRHPSCPECNSRCGSIPAQSLCFGRFLADIQVEPSEYFPVAGVGLRNRCAPTGPLSRHPRTPEYILPGQNLCCGYNDLRTVPRGHPRNSERNNPSCSISAQPLCFERFLTDIQVEPNDNMHRKVEPSLLEKPRARGLGSDYAERCLRLSVVIQSGVRASWSKQQVAHLRGTQ